jgi:hypothetical protein
MKIIKKIAYKEDKVCCINHVVGKNIEHVREDGDKKHIKNKNQENQCRKKATKHSRRK